MGDNAGVIAFQPSPDVAWKYENEWSTGIFSCCENIGECVYSFFCFPCFSCHLSWRLRESACIFCCVPCSIGVLRTKIRTMFRIDGSMCRDCCLSVMCPMCTQLQITRELQYREIV